MEWMNRSNCGSMKRLMDMASLGDLGQAPALEEKVEGLGEHLLMAQVVVERDLRELSFDDGIEVARDDFLALAGGRHRRLWPCLGRFDRGRKRGGRGHLLLQ